MYTLCLASLPTTVTVDSKLECLRIPSSMVFYVGATVIVETGHVSFPLSI